MVYPEKGEPKRDLASHEMKGTPAELSSRSPGLRRGKTLHPTTRGHVVGELDLIETEVPSVEQSVCVRG